MWTKRLFAAIILALAMCACACAEFVPEQPIIPVSKLKPGMKGYVLTVLRGTQPERLPVRIVSISPKKPADSLTDEILIQFTGRHKLAQGMSGSPLFVNGKLAGAVRSGWENSDHKLAAVTPIESMCKVFAYPDMPGPFMNSLTLSGLNVNTPSIQKLASSLGLTFAQGISGSSQSLVIDNSRLKPGDSLSVLLVWGDVEIGAVGAVTATDRDGRFLAFGHPLLKRGSVSFPAARTFIHETIDSVSFPFKLFSPSSIIGSVTQDREAAIGGTFGMYPLSVSAKLVFKDLDLKTERTYNFRVAADEFLSHKLLDGVYSGLAEEAWGRKGEGTMKVTLRIDSAAVPNGWTRSEIFFSEDNVLTSSFNQAIKIINAFLTQPFRQTMPAGFTITVEATQNPKVLIIEDIIAPESVKAGSEFEVTVKLRGWRREPFERKFKMRIPESASGITELIVRGGSVEPLSQVAVEEGYMTINSLERMLTEIRAIDSNNELIIELNNDNLADALKKALSKKHSKTPSQESDLLPEEEEFLSETKARRIREGTLRIFSTDYFIDGMMKRIIHVHND